MLPVDSAIHFTDLVASYLQAKFRICLSGKDFAITPPLDLPTQLVIDCDVAAGVLASALLTHDGKGSECMYHSFTRSLQAVNMSKTAFGGMLKGMPHG
jgi:hypothetical protein